MPDFLIHFFQMDRVPLAMAALLLVGVVGALTGPLFASANPLFWAPVNFIFGGIGGRLDRLQRKAGDLFLRGFVLTLLGVVLFYGCGIAARMAVGLFPLYGATEIILLSTCLGGGATWFAMMRLLTALSDNKSVVNNAYGTIARTTRSDLSGSDNYTITRVGMGMAARIFDKGLVAPLFWYMLGGLPMVFVYAGVAALTWRFAKDGFSKGFGRFPAVLEAMMGVVPHIISGILMALAGLLTPSGGMTRAFIGLFRRKGAAPYTEGGLPVTAMAYALGVSLNGPVTDLNGSAIPRKWAGPDHATAKLNPGHLRRGLYICAMAYLLFLTLLGGILLAVRLGSGFNIL